MGSQRVGQYLVNNKRGTWNRYFSHTQRECSSANALILDFQCQNEKTNFCCFGYLVCGTLLWRSSKLTPRDILTLSPAAGQLFKQFPPWQGHSGNFTALWMFLEEDTLKLVCGLSVGGAGAKCRRWAHGWLILKISLGAVWKDHPCRKSREFTAIGLTPVCSPRTIFRA